MPDAVHIDVPAWGWVAFNAYVVALLLADLFLFNREAHKIEVREAAWLSAFFVGAALLVNGLIWWHYGSDPGLTFFTAYVVEKSLSVDNLFVIAVLFGYFGVPAKYQHRVLFWGIFGAIVMRAVMILLGVALIERFGWLLYIFGAFLIVTGVRMFFETESAEDVADNKILRVLRRALPVTKSYHGERFFVRKMGRLFVTPLFLVLVMIELTDVVFAVDSIPAILGVTTDPFLAYSSNILAVTGLRALYFLLAGVIERLRYLHYGLGAVLVFIGLKMLAAEGLGVHLPTWLSLTVITVCIGGAALLSWLADRRDRDDHLPPPPGAPTPGGAHVPSGGSAPPREIAGEVPV